MSLGTQGKEKKNLKLSVCNVFLRVGSKESMQNNYSDTVKRVQTCGQGMNNWQSEAMSFECPVRSGISLSAVIQRRK